MVLCAEHLEEEQRQNQLNGNVGVTNMWDIMWFVIVFLVLIALIFVLRAGLLWFFKVNKVVTKLDTVHERLASIEMQLRSFLE